MRWAELGTLRDGKGAGVGVQAEAWWAARVGRARAQFSWGPKVTEA